MYAHAEKGKPTKGLYEMVSRRDLNLARRVREWPELDKVGRAEKLTNQNGIGQNVQLQNVQKVKTSPQVVKFSMNEE